jgi:transposase
MKDTSLYEQILGLEKPWRVADVKLDVGSEQVDVWLEHGTDAKWSCPECGRASRGYDHSEERTWRHLDTCQFKTLIHARVPRIECDQCGVKQVKVPWAEGQGGFTLLMERMIIDLLQECKNIKGVCKILDIHWDSCFRVMKEAVRRGQLRKQAAGIRYVGVDEKAFCRGHSYVTLVSDLEASTVEWVEEERRAESLQGYYRQLSDEHREQIRAVVMDMWPAYIKATRDELDQGREKIVFDRFHVMRELNWAVDMVRKRENAALRKEGDERLKKTKYLWLFSPENLPPSYEHSFEQLRRSELKTARAWHLKELFRHLWDYKRMAWAIRFFRQWYTRAMRSQLQPIMKVARKLHRHLEGIVAYCKHPYTNAVTEGLNSKIMAVKRLVGGFRNVDNFKTAIYFYCGRLELYPR